jgi:hypothetical protein
LLAVLAVHLALAALCCCRLARLLVLLAAA